MQKPTLHRGVILSLLLFPSAAFAGMPTLVLDDVARMRLEAISFFALAFVVCGKLVQMAWNSLRKDFVRLPELSFGRSMAMLCLWGLLFVLVLTMISGARELMTPGAWKKDGFTYKLKDHREISAAEQQLWERIESERWTRLAELKVALWNYAKAHDGVLPSDMSNSGIADQHWRTPEPSGIRYRYIGGQQIGQGERLVAAEPPVFAPPRLGLLSDGRIRQLTDEQMLMALQQEVQE